MFEKITDFDGKKFQNLLDGISCECFADNVSTFVIFYKNGKEFRSFSGNEANDILDFVLSEYYTMEMPAIEDAFNKWLGEYINNNEAYNAVSADNGKVEYNTALPFDNVTLSARYNCLLQDWNRLNKIIGKLCGKIKAKNRYIRKLKDENRLLKKKIAQMTEHKGN